MPEVDEVRVERMRPGQIAACRRRADVALLPLGALEWHGVHNPIGVDAIKAHAVCCAAAERLGGGAVFPALVYGVPRDSFFMGTFGSAGDLTEPVARALDTEPERVRGFAVHGGMDVQEQWLFFQRLVRMSLEQVAGFGFRSIYVVTGHNPLIHWAKPAVTAFVRAAWMAGQPVTALCGGEFDAAGLGGDHAGRWETSLTMAVDPSLVDLAESGRYGADGMVGCRADAGEASEEQGRAWLAQCAEAIAAEARALVEHWPEAPPKQGHVR